VVHRPGVRPPAGAGGLAVDDPHDPAQVAAALGRMGINDLLVEGGATVHAAWLAAGLYDRLEIQVGDLELGAAGPAAPGFAAEAWQEEAPARRIGSTLVTCHRRRAHG
jgi:riboflavin biosynthesis pyrimidine reductase